MNCNEIFNVGIFYATDAYKRVCKFNEELHADIEKYRAENAKLRELCTALYRCRDKVAECATCEEVKCPFAGRCMMHARMRELGVEE